MRLRCLAVFLLAAALTAHADTIVQNFGATFTMFATTTYYQSIARFDPSLGTLTSVSESVMGTITTSQNRVLLQLQLNTSTLALNDYGTGLQSVSLSGSTTNSGDLASATGSGLAPFTLVTTNQGAGSSSVALTGSVTYTYTPKAVAVTPEPSSIALLGTGLLGIGVAVRRRLTAE